MTRDVSRFLAPDFLSLTIGIVVYFVGVLTTQRVKLLRNFSIPEPVSGGFIAVAAFSLIYFVFNLEIDFDLTTRDRLLVIFFATVGINSRLADLVAGGRALLVLCVISAVFVFIQNIVGTAGALAFGMPSAAGVVIGSLALSGGHGTTIAWAPLIAIEHDFPAAMETGIAVATLGLIIACVLGGPIAKYLIEKYGLQPSSADPSAGRRQSPNRQNGSDAGDACGKHRSNPWLSCARLDFQRYYYKGAAVCALFNNGHWPV
jgi:glutamate:Na+ symporter, ESS family